MAAAPPSPKPPRVPGQYLAKNEWAFWFELKECARLRDWQKLHDTLEDNPHLRLASQNFTDEAFHTACNLGRPDVIDALMKRGYTMDEETAEKTFERIAAYYPEHAPAVIGYFARNGFDVKSAIYKTALQGKPETMQAFRREGCDILQEESSFFLAFEAGNIPMMHYLAAQGANLYAASALRVLYKEDNKDRAAAKETYRHILANESDQLAGYYAYVAPNKPDLADLRDVPYGLEDKNTTLLQLAARTGYFAEIKTAAAREKRAPLMAADFLTEDANGHSALSILAARGELEQAVDPALWQHAPGEIQKLAAALEKMRLPKLIDAPAAIAAAERHRLRAIAPKGRFSLKGGPKP